MDFRKLMLRIEVSVDQKFDMKIESEMAMR